MATQSKSVSQLKSEVLKTSSRPYELIEYNSDKLITKEINPELVASNVNFPYEKNSNGTIIIDKNKDLTKRKMLISLTATKISNAKFNEIIDTEFQDFVESVDLSQNFLSSQINGMQIKAATDAADKKVLEAKIAGLLNQNEALKAASALSRILVNTAPDSISYGTDLNADKSGIGNMLLSKNKKARAVITNTQFNVTLGNYDHTGKLIDGEEVVTFQPVFAGNIGTKNLTDDEASNYLINNPDLYTYFYSYTAASQAKFAEIQTGGYNGLQSLVAALNIEFAAANTTLSEASLADINAYLDLSTPDKNSTENNPSSNTRRAILTSNAASQVYIKNGVSITATADIFNLKTAAAIQTQLDIIRFRHGSYLAAASTVADKAYWTRFYTSVKMGVESKLEIVNPPIPIPFAANIIALRKKIAEDIRSYKNIASSYNIVVPGGTRSIPINDLITAADRALLDTQIISGWSATKNLIETVKKHWRYVVEQKPNELSFRSYLSDAQVQSYSNNYPDLVAGTAAINITLKQHWNYYGINEGRTYAAGNTILQIWRSSADKKGYMEIVTTMPWHVRWTSEYMDLSKSSRIFLDDNGILYLYDKAKIVWQSYNEDE